MPRCQEVLCRQPSACCLVDRDHGHVSFRVAFHGHNRHTRTKMGQGVVSGSERGNHREALDGLAHEPAHRLAHRLAVQPVNGGYRNEIALVLGGPLKTGQSRSRPVEGGIRGDDPEGFRTPAGERPGRWVGTVPQLVDRRQDPGTSHLPYARMVVQHPGYGLMRNPG